MHVAFKSVLVATDFGPASDLAIEYARTLALTFRAELHLLHVVEEPFPIGSDLPVPEVSPFRLSVLREAHDELARVIAGISDLDATGRVLIGHPARRIIETASALDADVIVMGTHGRGGVRRLLMGSVAELVVRTARCPVLTVHEADVPLAEPWPAAVGHDIRTPAAEPVGG